jgi:hypothetical protein
LCGRLVRLQVVAFERPDGLLIERLLDADLAVVAVYPNQRVLTDLFPAVVRAELQDEVPGSNQPPPQPRAPRQAARRAIPIVVLVPSA